MKSGKWEWEMRLGEALQAFVRILSNTLSEKGSHSFEYRRDIIRLLKGSPWWLEWRKDCLGKREDWTAVEAGILAQGLLP